MIRELTNKIIFSSSSSLIDINVIDMNVKYNVFAIKLLWFNYQSILIITGFLIL